MWRGQRQLFDFVGWAAWVGEWFALWLLAADHDGLVYKEDVRGCFDGSLFFRIAERRRRERREVKVANLRGFTAGPDAVPMPVAAANGKHL
jgi:hypothetical protein